MQLYETKNPIIPVGHGGTLITHSDSCNTPPTSHVCSLKPAEP